jgi:hypothetical protein
MSTTITDDFMKEMMTTTKDYTVLLLKKTGKFKMPDVYPVIWEHGRRNFSLRANGLLSIVCPIPNDPVMAGIGVFNTTEEETRKIMDEDPAVVAGVLSYELYAARSFPGDMLPE